MSKVAYRGCWIQYDPPPIPMRNYDWAWWDDNYSGAPDARDHRHGNAPSLDGLLDAMIAVGRVPAPQEPE